MKVYIIQYLLHDQPSSFVPIVSTTLALSSLDFVLDTDPSKSSTSNLYLLIALQKGT